MVAKVIVVVTKTSKKQMGVGWGWFGTAPPSPFICVACISQVWVLVHFRCVTGAGVRLQFGTRGRQASLHKWLGKLACGLVWDGCGSALESYSWFLSVKRSLTDQDNSAESRCFEVLPRQPVLRSQVWPAHLNSRHSSTFALNKLAHLWFAREASKAPQLGVEGTRRW